jgi:hypothetical protein
MYSLNPFSIGIIISEISLGLLRVSLTGGFSDLPHEATIINIKAGINSLVNFIVTS